MIKYMLAIPNGNDGEVFCNDVYGKNYKTTNINEAYQFRNKYWGDRSNVYVKEVEEAE